MPNLSRRAGLALVAAAPLAMPAILAAAARPAAAAAPPVGRPAPGWFRFKVGEAEVTVLHDGYFLRPNPTQGFVRNATPDQVRSALNELFQPTDQLPMPFNVTVVNTGRNLVLFDTGNGTGGRPTTRFMLENLRASGIEPGQIDTVIISHFHGDHITGLTTPQGNPTFPNARVVAPEPEWAFWMDDGQMSRGAQGLQGTFQNSRRQFTAVGDRLERYVPGQGEIVPGVTSIAAPGHTPGHCAFRVASGNAQLLVTADTAISSLFLRNPDWHPANDMDGPTASTSRRRLLDMAAADRIPITAYHLPSPSAGWIVRRGAGFEHVPMPYSMAL